MGKFIACFVFIALLLFGISFALKSCGKGGDGNGDGDGSGTGTSTAESAAPDPTENTKIAEIKIEEDKIYFDGELCADENDLKDKIIVIGTEKEYHFVHDKAIKATYDKVNSVLSDLKDALGITVIDQ